MHICMTRPTLSSWDDLRVLLAVADHGSLSAAAKRLGTDQSTLSRRLSALEASLCATLVERQRQGCRLTPAGSRVIAEARLAELQIHRFVDSVSAEEPRVVGAVRIACTEGLAIHFLVPEVLPSLLRSHPELRVELVTSTAPADLARHEADIALRFFRDRSGELTIRRLGAIPRAVLAHHRLARQLARRDADSWPWVGASLDAYEGEWLRSVGVSRLAISSPSYETQLAALRAGLGAGVQAQALLKLFPELRAITAVAPPPPLELFLVTRAAARKTARVAVVAQRLTEAFAAFFTPR